MNIVSLEGWCLHSMSNSSTGLLLFHLGMGAPNGSSGCPCLPKVVFTPHFLKIVVEIWTADCLRLVVGVSKGMLPENYLCSHISCFCISFIV